VAVLGGSSAGLTYLSGPLVVPFRLTLAGDAHLFAVSTFAGAGIAAHPGAGTTLYAAPALRLTSLLHFTEGLMNERSTRFDAAAVVGLRHQIWRPRCHGGWDAFVEAAAPMGSSGPWFLSAGITQSWGPKGGYFFTGCPSEPSKPWQPPKRWR
jgi:hypothetical protein